MLSHFLPCFVPSRLSVGLFVAVVGMESFCINKPNISGFDFGAFYLNLQNFLGLLVFLGFFLMRASVARTQFEVFADECKTEGTYCGYSC